MLIGSPLVSLDLVAGSGEEVTVVAVVADDWVGAFVLGCEGIVEEEVSVFCEDLYWIGWLLPPLLAGLSSVSLVFFFLRRPPKVGIWPAVGNARSRGMEC